MANGDDLLPILIERIAAAHGKQKLEKLLRDTRDRLGLGRHLRVTGTLAELQNAVQGAVVDGHIAEQEIRDLVDEVEENGAQHIFLYRLTDAGRRNLTANRLAAAFHEPPQRLSTRFYGPEPPRQQYFMNRNPTLFVKQVYTGEYWEAVPEESERTATRRVTVQELKRRRAVNLLRIDRTTGNVEIRIDRLHGRDDPTLAVEELERFELMLSTVSDVVEDLEPLAIRANFSAIARERDRTFMSVDRAQDPSVAQKISSRREGHQGTDVRDHPNYRMEGVEYVRDSVPIYWEVAQGRFVYTVISAIDFEIDGEDVEYTKVYVSAKVTADELEQVLDRIRHFAV